MKTIIISCIILAGISLGLKSGKKEILKESYGSNELYSPVALYIYNSESKKPDDEKFSDDWYGKVSESIINDEYKISFSDELNSYQSPNRENNMRFIYHQNGFNVTPRDNEQSADWEIDFKVNEMNRVYSAQRTSRQMEFLLKGSELKVADNKAFIEDDNIRVEYTNDKDGMRQDFIIKNKPDGEGNLRLNLSATTKLKMIAGADALMFKDNAGDCKMKYSSLKCWDTKGKELRAYFEKNNYELGIMNYELKNKSKIRNQESKIKRNLKSQIRNSNFQIVVNDEDAVYPITIDPLSSSPNWTAESNSDKAAMGSSVCSAGDVNGDGYGDVIIGAPEYDNGIYRQGKVYVFHGSATGLSSSPNWTFLGNQNQCYFGTCVSTAGDVNGDGYSDIIIGSPDYSNGQTKEGKVFAFYGSASGLSQSANWTAESNLNNAKFGVSVSSCGDVNGDGYSDVIIGASTFNNGPNGKGKAFAYYGSASGLSLNSNWSMESFQDNSGFGNSVATAGDVNGDGYSDVIVAAYLYDSGQIDEGKVFAYYGSSSGLSTVSNWTAESNQTAAEFGFSISTAGDVNGDGYSDIIIGAEKFDQSQTDAGKIFVYYGSASGLVNSVSWFQWENQTAAYFGYSVSLAGDVNGDGYSDVMASAVSYDNGETDEGKVYLYYGSSTGLSPAPNWTAEGNQVAANFGSSVFTAGDVNGDGISDIMIGANKFDNGQPDEGKVFVYYGSASGLSQTYSWFKSGGPDSKWGMIVTNAGDVNGDGYSDIIVSAPNYNASFHFGLVLAYYGSATGFPLAPSWTLFADLPYAEFGTSISTAGDVNGDGYSDVIIGAYNDTTALNGHTGKAYLFLGSASGLSTTPDWIVNGGQDGCYFGYSVSTAGDVNGDGFSDVIVGAMKYHDAFTDQGKIFVYYGSAAGLSPSPSYTFSPYAANKYFGRSVSSAGDFNGDGFGDVVVGGSNYVLNGSNNNGSFYVIQGTGNGLVQGYTLNASGVNENATLGWSVACAGDVNGDGYSDIIVGVPKYSNGQAEEGKILVYYGAPVIYTSSIPWAIESNIALANFGQCVSGAGDVNGDGYSDIITGAWNYYNGQFYVGAAFVYYGSSSGLSETNYWAKISTTVFSEFGYCVSSAGDVNGDGYSDVIIGSPGYNFQGAAFVYYGNEKNGVKSNIQQYKPNSNNVVSPGGYTGTLGSAKLSLFGKNFSGRADGKLVYECKQNGQPFTSGSNISNSVSSSGTGAMTDVSGTGMDLSKNISGLMPDKEYKWRARVQFSPVNNPYQKFGPWKYYSNYMPNPSGNFRPTNVFPKTFTLGVNIEGSYDQNTNIQIGDTVRVYLRNPVSPNQILDSSITITGSSGFSEARFYNDLNGNPFYVQIKHRNSIETWSSATVSYINNLANYYFQTDVTKALGNNLKQKGSKWCIYSGDVNQDGYIDLNDINLVFNAASSFLTGYVATDVTGDNIVDLSDLTIAFNNSSAFVSKVTP